MKPIIAVWFSCGAASAVAAKKTIEQYGGAHDVLIVNNPVAEEDADNLRFLADVEKWLGHEIITANNKNFPSNSIKDVFNKRKYMSGVKGAPCTQELKKEARYQFELKHYIAFHVLGFTVDEKERHERFIKFERSNVLPVLIDSGITKQDCFNILLAADIDLPSIYKKGFPNANCIGCVKSSSPTYWRMVQREFPEVFKDRAEQSRQIGCRLIKVKSEEKDEKGKFKRKRIYLDELTEEHKGGKLKSYECGIFCDTK